MKKKYLLVTLISIISFGFLQGCNTPKETVRENFYLVTKENCRYSLVIGDDKYLTKENSQFGIEVGEGKNKEWKTYPVKIPIFNSEEEAMQYIEELGGGEKIDVYNYSHKAEREEDVRYQVGEQYCQYTSIMDYKDSRHLYPKEGIEFETHKDAREYIFWVSGGGRKE